MSSFEWNKVIASVLTAMIVAMVAGILSTFMVHPERLEKQAYVPPGAEAGAKVPTEAAAAAPAGPEPIAPLMAKADPKRGQQSPRSACNATPSTRASPTRSAPTCSGSSPRKISPPCPAPVFGGLAKHKDEKWDPDKLNVWLFKPQEFAQGHQDDLCRPAEGAGPRRRDRLPRNPEIGASGRRLDRLLALAADLADAAGEAIRPYFRQPLEVDDKPDLSPVTAADRGAEAAMRRLIAARFPEHGIIGEEFGREREDAEFVWVLDPIDGTKSFISGRAAVRHADRAGAEAAGRSSASSTSRSRASAGSARRAARRRSTAPPVRCRPCPALAAATVFATSPDMFKGADAAAFARAAAAAKLVRYGADCYASGLLALGLYRPCHRGESEAL